MFRLSVILLPFLILALAAPAAAEDAYFATIIGDPAMENHWPEDDGHLGTADDWIHGGTSPMWGSGPNFQGSYSYNAFDFGSGETDTGMPTGYNAITFVLAEVGIDLDVAAGGGGPLVITLNCYSGTEPFLGHGPYSAQFSAINSGSYDPGTHVFTLNVDFSAELAGGPDEALGMDISGVAYVVEEEDFETPTGHAYVDEVLIPRAQAQQASRLLYLRGSGTIPPAEGGSWGSMPFLASLVGLTDGVAAGESSWSRLKALY